MTTICPFMSQQSSNEATVVKANSLVQASYRLSLAEQQLILCAISQIGMHEALIDQKSYSVDALTFREFAGVPRQRAYKALKDASKRLFDRKLTLPFDENSKDGDTREIRWVQEAGYKQSEGRVEIVFSRRIAPYISQLREEFTSYKMRHVAKMRSSHGIRLYELLMQWRQYGEREIGLVELRRIFGIEGRYKSIRDLKRYVIEPAVRDVNECSNLTVTWGQLKQGRQVSAIRFGFASKRQKPKKPEKMSESERKKYLERHARRGEQYEDTARRLGV